MDVSKRAPNPEMPLETLWPVLAFALSGLLLGVCLLRALAKQDHWTWVLARAPALPIRVLAVGDDAWLRGVVRSETKLDCPHFEVPCVAYDYQRERLHEWTTRDKDGKVEHHSEWRTEHSEARAVDFVLDDGAQVLVRAAGARNEALRSLGTARESRTLRHRAAVLEPGARISVLGVLQEDRSFAGEREVPCLWTREARDQRVRSSGRSETWWFVAACGLAALGGVGACLWWRLAIHQQAFDAGVVAAALGAGVLLGLPVWWLGVHNRLIRLRQQVHAAFRQVDVDLAVRAGLVPNLTAVVQRFAGHERQLLADVARWRAGASAAAAVEADRSAQRTAHAVLRLHEQHPTLRADALYQDLHDRLWAVEEKLAHTRQLYNDIATEWNTCLWRFPEALVASLLRSRPAPLFAGEDAPLPPRLRG